MRRHEHDCDCCTYLGESGKFDLYCCGGSTVIARYGPLGHYKSGLVFVDRDPELAVAAVRALKTGALTPERLNMYVTQGSHWGLED